MPSSSKIETPWNVALAFAVAFTTTAVVHAHSRQAHSSTEGELTVTANFTDKQSVKPLDQIELLLNRALNSSEERIAVLIGTTDVSSLFTQDKLRLRYGAKLWPLPLGEWPVTVYLVSNDKWKEIAQFTLRVDKEAVGNRT